MFLFFPSVAIRSTANAFFDRKFTLTIFLVSLCHSLTLLHKNVKTCTHYPYRCLLLIWEINLNRLGMCCVRSCWLVSFFISFHTLSCQIRIFLFYAGQLSWQRQVKKHGVRIYLWSWTTIHLSHRLLSGDVLYLSICALLLGTTRIRSRIVKIYAKIMCDWAEWYGRRTHRNCANEKNVSVCVSTGCDMLTLAFDRKIVAIHVVDGRPSKKIKICVMLFGVLTNNQLSELKKQYIATSLCKIIASVNINRRIFKVNQ